MRNAYCPISFQPHLYLCNMANRLAHEQSPYLLQHAHNPVDWYPWGDEAFDKAKREHKPVIVSIGYAACHWCHVMERESFEDAATAACMNEHFVCVKVDREEHPDVDHMYMDAVQAISGSGGWPLNVFATADRVPFYGGTYFPPRPAYSRPSWLQVMQRMIEIWTNRHDEVKLQADQMVNHLRQASMRATAQGELQVDTNYCNKVAETLLTMADKEWGGFGNAPKFPGTMAISYLLDHYTITGNEQSLAQALRSLDAMIEGGIYDQIGGGFARYATDREWLIPHFEKMLYDNALIIGSLADAYTVTKNDKYKEVIDQTIAFVNRELSNGKGGFYCALDADSEGVEGKFYTWTWEQWQQYSGDSNGVIASYYGVSEHGNWEETNILHIAMPADRVALEADMSIAQFQQTLAQVNERLFQARSARVRPLTDDKCLLSWNALMNIALIKAGQALGNQAYIAQAELHAAWMLGAYRTGGQLLHTWKNGAAKISAKLDDYAYLMKALLLLTAATGNTQWATTGRTLLTTVLEDFGADDVYFYFTPASQTDIPVRKVDLYDGATPAPNSVMAYNLMWYGMCFEESQLIYRAQKMLAGMQPTVVRYAYSFAGWAQLLQHSGIGCKTIVVSGKQVTQAMAQLYQKALPNTLIVACKKQISDLPVLAQKFFNDDLYIFVCSEQSCAAPVSSIADVLLLLHQ